MRDEPDHYLVLGVPRTADRDEIERAFRRHLRQQAAASGSGPSGSSFMNAVHDAFLLLSDPCRRAEYDARC